MLYVVIMWKCVLTARGISLNIYFDCLLVYFKYFLRNKCKNTIVNLLLTHPVIYLNYNKKTANSFPAVVEYKRNFLSVNLVGVHGRKRVR